MSTELIIGISWGIVWLLGIFIGLIQYFIKRYDTSLDRLRSYKVSVYEEFISVFIDLLMQVEKDEEKRKRGFSEWFNNTYKKMILFASTDTINAIADFMQYIYKNTDNNELDTKEMSDRLVKVFVLMREEVGLKNKALHSWNIELLRPILKDIDEYMKK